MIALDQQTAFEAWTPLPNLTGEVVLTKLEDSGGRLEITLQGDNSRLLKVEADGVLAYRLDLKSLNAKFSEFESAALPHGVLWKAIQSGWISEVDAGAEQEEISHFLLITAEEVVQFLSTQTPHVSWLDNFFGDAI